MNTPFTWTQFFGMRKQPPDLTGWDKFRDNKSRVRTLQRRAQDASILAVILQSDKLLAFANKKWDDWVVAMEHVCSESKIKPRVLLDL